eukprot:g2360.t1
MARVLNGEKDPSLSPSRSPRVASAAKPVSVASAVAETAILRNLGTALVGCALGALGVRGHGCGHGCGVASTGLASTPFVELLELAEDGELKPEMVGRQGLGPFVIGVETAVLVAVGSTASAPAGEGAGVKSLLGALNKVAKTTMTSGCADAGTSAGDGNGDDVNHEGDNQSYPAAGAEALSLLQAAVVCHQRQLELSVAIAGTNNVSSPGAHGAVDAGAGVGAGADTAASAEEMESAASMAIVEHSSSPAWLAQQSQALEGSSCAHLTRALSLVSALVSSPTSNTTAAAATARLIRLSQRRLRLVEMRLAAAAAELQNAAAAELRAHEAKQRQAQPKASATSPPSGMSIQHISAGGIDASSSPHLQRMTRALNASTAERMRCHAALAMVQVLSAIPSPTPAPMSTPAPSADDDAVISGDGTGAPAMASSAASSNGSSGSGNQMSMSRMKSRKRSSWSLQQLSSAIRSLTLVIEDAQRLDDTTVEAVAHSHLGWLHSRRVDLYTVSADADADADADTNGPADAQAIGLAAADADASAPVHVPAPLAAVSAMKQALRHSHLHYHQLMEAYTDELHRADRRAKAAAAAMLGYSGPGSPSSVRKGRRRAEKEKEMEKKEEKEEHGAGAGQAGGKKDSEGEKEEKGKGGTSAGGGERDGANTDGNSGDADAGEEELAHHAAALLVAQANLGFLHLKRARQLRLVWLRERAAQQRAQRQRQRQRRRSGIGGVGAAQGEEERLRVQRAAGELGEELRHARYFYELCAKETRAVMEGGPRMLAPTVNGSQRLQAAQAGGEAVEGATATAVDPADGAHESSSSSSGSSSSKLGGSNGAVEAAPEHPDLTADGGERGTSGGTASTDATGIYTRRLSTRSSVGLLGGGEDGDAGWAVRQLLQARVSEIDQLLAAL